MKLTRVFTAFLLILSLLTVSVCAAEFVPSKERPGGPEVIVTPGEEDNEEVAGEIVDDNEDKVEDVHEGELIITPILDVDKDPENIPDDVKEALREAEKDLTENELTDLINDFEDVWKDISGGSPVENAEIFDVFDVRLVDGVIEILDPENHTLVFTIKYEDLTLDDIIHLIYKELGSDTWEHADYVVNPDGTITVRIPDEGIIAVIKDSGAAPAVSEDAPQSPQTGVAEYSAAAMMGVVLFGGLAFAAVKKGTKKHHAA